MTAAHAAKEVLASAYRRDDEPVLAAMPLKPDNRSRNALAFQ